MRKIKLPPGVRAVMHDRRFLLGCLWCFGLVIGTVLAVGADDSFLSLMRLAASSRVSIVELMTAILLPFLFSALAVYMGRPRALYVICFCKAACFAFCAVLTARSFGTAGWLVQPMLCFSDLILAPVLIWFCIRHIGGSLDRVQRDLAVCAFFIVLAAVLDAYLVSPFLAKLIIR